MPNEPSSPSFFIDIDGVLYGGGVPTEKGPQVLEYLRERNFKFVLVTNTSRMTRTQIARKLLNLGYQVQEEEIFPTSTAAAKYLRKRFKKADCFVIGDNSLRDVLEEHGHRTFVEEEPADAIVIGQSKWADFRQIDIARRLVVNGAEVVALHRDLTWPDGDVTRIALGPIVAAMESVIDGPVTVIGKPEKKFFTAALQHAKFQREHTIMIGDSVQSDIRGAIDSGLKSLLVRTGNGTNECIPTDCGGELATIADLPDWCEKNLPKP